MSDRAFVVTAVVGLALGALCLALAAALDSALLAVGGAVFVIAALVAREGWLDGRQWRITLVALTAIVATAFVAQQLT